MELRKVATMLTKVRRLRKLRRGSVTVDAQTGSLVQRAGISWVVPDGSRIMK